VSGFHAERVPVDIGGSPTARVCERMTALFIAVGDLNRGITLAVTPRTPRDLWISMLISTDRGRGLASHAMDVLTFLCDIHGVTIRMQSVSLKGSRRDGATALDQSSLDAFYARRGFVPDDGEWKACSMIRTPGAPARIVPRLPAPKCPDDLLSGIRSITHGHVPSSRPIAA